MSLHSHWWPCSHALSVFTKLLTGAIQCWFLSSQEHTMLSGIDVNWQEWICVQALLRPRDDQTGCSVEVCYVANVLPPSNWEKYHNDCSQSYQYHKISWTVQRRRKIHNFWANKPVWWDCGSFFAQKIVFSLDQSQKSAVPKPKKRINIR